MNRSNLLAASSCVQRFKNTHPGTSEGLMEQWPGNQSLAKRPGLYNRIRPTSYNGEYKFARHIRGATYKIKQS
jgi:hypothetical protein